MDVAEASAYPPGLNKPKTILIADDNAMVRTVIREAIQRDTNFEVCGEAVAMAPMQFQKPKSYHQT